METLLNILGFIGALVVLLLAGAGAAAIVTYLSRETDERLRLRRQAFESERQIMEIGRQAQMAILGEALRSYRSRWRPEPDAPNPDGPRP